MTKNYKGKGSEKKIRKKCGLLPNPPRTLRLLHGNMHTFICSLYSWLQIVGHIHKSNIFKVFQNLSPDLLDEGPDLCPLIFGHHLLKSTMVAGHVDAQLLISHLYIRFVKYRRWGEKPRRSLCSAQCALSAALRRA